MNKCEHCHKEFVSNYWGRPDKQKYCPGIDGKRSQCLRKSINERAKISAKKRAKAVTQDKEKEKEKEKRLQDILCKKWEKGLILW